MKNLTITPVAVIIDNEHHDCPETVSIVLPTGESFSIQETVELLEQHVKTKHKPSFKWVRRARNIKQAVDQALREELPDERS